MEILKFIVPMGEDPRPGDYTAEAETARAILQFCETPGTTVTPETMQAFAPTTPWVSWQLGIAAEIAAGEQNFTPAMKLATAATIAAHMARSTEFIFSSLLICGNLLLLQQEYEEALDTYQTLLRLPFSGGVAPRAAAHLAIGTIARQHTKDPKKAIYHYEHAMRFYGPRAYWSEVLHFWKSISGLYLEADDEVGKDPGHLPDAASSGCRDCSIRDQDIARARLASRCAARLLRQGSIGSRRSCETGTPKRSVNERHRDFCGPWHRRAWPTM